MQWKDERSTVWGPAPYFLLRASKMRGAATAPANYLAAMPAMPHVAHGQLLSLLGSQSPHVWMSCDTGICPASSGDPQELP